MLFIFCCLFMSSCMAHSVDVFGFFLSILWNSIIVLWTSNWHQRLHQQTGEKQMGEPSLLSQAVKWDDPKNTLWNYKAKKLLIDKYHEIFLQLSPGIKQCSFIKLEGAHHMGLFVWRKASQTTSMSISFFLSFSSIIKTFCISRCLPEEAISYSPKLPPGILNLISLNKHL